MRLSLLTSDVLSYDFQIINNAFRRWPYADLWKPLIKLTKILKFQLTIQDSNFPNRIFLRETSLYVEP